MVKYSSQTMVQKLTLTLDIMNALLMKALIKIPMLQPVKFTGPFFKKNDMGITAEGLFRSSLILQMKLKAVSTVQNHRTKKKLQLLKLVEPSEILKASRFWNLSVSFSMM